MSGSTEPRIVAEVGGLAVTEHGPLVTIVDRRTGPWATTAFVLGVAAIVFGGFGAVTLTLAAADASGLPWWLSTACLAVGLAFAGTSTAAVGRIRRANRTPLSGHRPIVIVDRARRVLTNADGAVLATLDEVHFATRTQLTSSSPMLVVATPHGTLILKRGNPFNGGLGDLPAVLQALVFPPSR